MIKTALQFYNGIKNEESKYRLINGLFIVKYLDDEISEYIGEFREAGHPLNDTFTNKVRLSQSRQKFNIGKKLATNARGDAWIEVRIKLEEKPIKVILDTGHISKKIAARVK